MTAVPKVKLTADTITDEQIRELRKIEPDLGRVGMSDRDIRLALRDGRGSRVFSERMVRAARARCAEILNARNEAKP